MALSIIQIIICVSIVVLVLMQESPKGGGSSAITGSSDSTSHYDKIKGRTSGAILKKVTAVLGVLFVVITFASNL